VKICGITRPQDAEAAVALGASAIGFIFWPNSPRCVTATQARQIVRRLPPFVTPVGVFVNQPVDEVNALADAARLAAVQLHGDETPDVVAQLERPVVKAVSRIEVDTASGWPANVLLLVDSHDPQRRGGTGVRADWLAAARLAAERPILLAGGLTPDNVADAAAQVRPFGIDVSSSVESSPGVKDHERLHSLFEAVRGLDRNLTVTRVGAR
jgi:phosphoribosylanthranilate isomerase